MFHFIWGSTSSPTASTTPPQRNLAYTRHQRNSAYTPPSRQRERENPCFVCGHYHKFEDGEVCGICGHRLQEGTEKIPHESAFSSEILPQFLFLGSYDNASRTELLKAHYISRILNTVPTCQNLYKNSFIYHSLKEDKSLPFTECLEFIAKNKAHPERA